MSQTARIISPMGLTYGREKAPGLGQDRFASFNALDGRGVIVCDGVGSESNSGEVAEAAVNAAKDLIARDGLTPHLIAQVNDHVSHFVDGHTTLLAATAHSTAGSWLVEYMCVGNGSMIEIVAGGRDNNPWMWWTDHFVPHVDFSTGKDTLAVALPCPPDELLWTAGQIHVAHGAARLILLVSDGIATVEDYRVGRMPDGSAWREIPELLDALLTAIRQPLLDIGHESRAEHRLATALTNTLDEFADASRLDDDASFGVILLPPDFGPNHNSDRPPTTEMAGSTQPLPGAAGPDADSAPPNVRDF